MDRLKLSDEVLVEIKGKYGEVRDGFYDDFHIIPDSQIENLIKKELYTIYAELIPNSIEYPNPKKAVITYKFKYKHILK